MTRQVLLIQGTGEGAYDEDKQLAARLERALGTDYKVHFPAMADEENAPYEMWKQQIEREIVTLQGPVVLAGHSIGAW